MKETATMFVLLTRPINTFWREEKSVFYKLIMKHLNFVILIDFCDNNYSINGGFITTWNASFVGNRIEVCCVGINLRKKDVFLWFFILRKDILFLKFNISLH